MEHSEHHSFEENQKRKKTFSCLLVSAALIALTILVILVLLQLVETTTKAHIQRLLDEQCGPGTVSVDEGGFSYDPIFSWDSPEANCREQLDGTIVCYCSGNQ